ncbi:putative phosphate transporter [Trypanosoma theileri]|uniref:Phosphate transporter n=1 Tax=Trypanosoma theileri TaxID=67003 RepID=A0A1X0P0T2_9TRYP|nr:putative phosphate transporter [Trypanosoma theileri]ORC90119.1 putative phosphate transporter [Trypanosoma theileri]
MHPTCDLPLNRSLPLVCICSLFSFLCGVGIGANDLSANFAMVVGSGSLNMRKAIVYCTLFELLGAAFMGGHVSGTIRNGIVDPILFSRDRDMVLIGMTCATFAVALWLYLSTVFGLPVSITHTVVGSILGFAIFSSGSFAYVQSRGIVKIVISWLLAPIAAGIVTSIIFYYLRKRILKVKRVSFQNALWSLPYCLAFSLLIELMFLVIEKPPILAVTLAQFMPLWVQYMLLFVVIVGFCFFSSAVLFPRLAEEAWRQNSFVWESDVLRTEVEAQGANKTKMTNTNITGDTAAAAAAADAAAVGVVRPTMEDTAVEEEPLRFSFVTATDHSATTTTHDNVSERADELSLQKSISTLLHGTCEFLQSSIGATDLNLLQQQRRVRTAPVVRRSPLPEHMHEREDPRGLTSMVSLTSTLVPSASKPITTSYGTLEEKRNVEEEERPVSPLEESSPSVIGVDDEFAEPDWGLDHPMQPIRFGGLLIKPFNPRAEYLYTALQVVAGSMSSFVHGAVAGANATATFVILYHAFAVGELKEEDPLDSTWAVLPAMLGIAIGMFTLGSRLMKTVGVELVTVTPARGWCIQVGGTLVTMLLTGIGIPVSLSQAQVGAAVGCGVLDARAKGVAWGIVFKIVCGWLVTLVISAVTTGVSMQLLASFYCIDQR